MSWNYARFASSLLIFHMINVHFMKYHKRSKAFKNQLREPQRSSSLRSGGKSTRLRIFQILWGTRIKRSSDPSCPFKKCHKNPFLFTKTQENDGKLCVFQEKTRLKSLTDFGSGLVRLFLPPWGGWAWWAPGTPGFITGTIGQLG